MCEPVSVLRTENLIPVSFFALVAEQRIVLSLMSAGNSTLCFLLSALMLPATLMRDSVINFVIFLKNCIFTLSMYRECKYTSFNVFCKTFSCNLH